MSLLYCYHLAHANGFVHASGGYALFWPDDERHSVVHLDHHRHGIDIAVIEVVM